MRKPKKINFLLPVSLHQDELIDLLISDRTPDQIFSLIKELDLAQSDWDFTKKVYAYFAKEMEKFEDEVKNEGGRTLALAEVKVSKG